MMTQQSVSNVEEIASLALNEGKNLGCSDVSVTASRSNDSQVRFSNNTITLVNNVRNVTLEVYVSKDKKKILGATYNPSEEGIKRFVRNLVASSNALPESEDYVPLPQGPFHYHGEANFDPKVADAPLVDYVKQAIDSGLHAGAKRVSGSLNTRSSEQFILTTGGASGRDRQSKMLLNVRAFAGDNASGHGLSCTSYTSDFEPAKAGSTAGDYAKRSLNPKMITEGKYKVVFTPTVVANILPVASSASAFSIESGMSFLVDRIEQRVSVQTLEVSDHGVYHRGLGGAVFDSEGTPTGQTQIIGNGTFRSMLHNTTTAAKFGTKSTGNAGIVAPQPITTEFGIGDISLHDMIRETREGVFISNNWYTRFQNLRTGEYSTVPRDAAFRIENGELAEPLYGLRVSDSIPRQLNNIELISDERQWIEWWEVHTPTFAPAMMIGDVSITRAVGN
jgi:PmbA protein